MIRLTQYSFRVLSLTCIVFIIINYPDLSYPLYFSGPLCLIPWLMYDLFLPGHISSGKLTGIILESISIISAIILLDTYLFSGFLILLFFRFNSFVMLLPINQLGNFNKRPAAIYCSYNSKQTVVQIVNPFVFNR